MISYRKLAMRVLGHSPVSAVKTARRSTAKRAAALALTAALVVGMTLPAFAETWYIEDGDISISAGESGNHVEQGDKKQDETTETIITNREPSTASSNTVTINADEGKTVNVTLDNVTINVDEGSKYGYEPNAYKTAVSVTGSGNTNIELNGNNTLTSGYGHAGLEHNKTDDSGTLTIQDEKNDDGSAKGSASDTTGSLTANGGGRGAGIGGSDEHDGQATITGGKITATGGNGAAGIGGGAGDKYAAVGGDGDVTISGGTITATGGSLGAGIGGGAYGNGTVTVTDGDITAKATGMYGAGIGGGAETEPDTEDTRNKVSIKSTEAGSPNITAAGGGVLNDENAPLAGAAAIGSGSVADGATEVKSDITVEGKVTIDATGGGDVAIGDSINGETQFSGLQVGTTITRRNANGDDVSQPGDVPEPEKPAQPTVTPTEGAEAPSTGSVEVERPVTVEGLYVTNVLGKQITHTCTQNGTTLTIRANGIVTSAHLTLGMVRTLKAQGVKTLVFTPLLSRSTTVSVDALLAAEPDAPDETAVVWTHTGLRAALTIGGADHSALLK